jgi:hypothetical protein
MKKRTRTLVILGVVLVLCIGAYIGVSVYTKAQAQKTADAAKAVQIYSEGRSAPVSISYESGGTALSFILENEKWCVADSKDFPLNQSALTSLSSAINGLSAVRTIDVPASLAIYGLDKPSYTVDASDNGGNALKLLIGAQNGDHYYAMTEGGSKVYTISSELVSDLKLNLLNMIILDTLPVLSEASIDVIYLDSGTSSLTLDKHQNADDTYTWFILNGTADTAAEEYVLPEGTDKLPEKYVNNAVKALASARFSSCTVYKPTSEDLTACGFDTPQATVTVDYTTTAGTDTPDQESTPGTVVFEIGGALDDGTGYYARISGSQQINVLSNTAAEPLIEALSVLGTAK